MQECNGIVFVRYVDKDEDHGPVHQWLTDLTLLYSHKAMVNKSTNDGSKPIIRTISKRGFCRTQIRICGVNAQWCVRSTVGGLKQKLPKSRLIAVADAINTTDYRGGDDLQHRECVAQFIDQYQIEVENRHLLLPELEEEAA
jgi:hypothetical protein